MAHWGRAMVLLDNPFLWPGSLTPAKLDEIAAALDAARSAGLKSEREKGYVEAVAAFVRDHDKVDYRTRLNAYDAAMAKLAARYPGDKEASILSALVTSANFDPADKTYANQLKAAKVLEPISLRSRTIPGVAHYLIHSYDYPPIAKHGLRSGQALCQDRAGCAARAAHALAHLHAGGPLAGLDRCEPGIGQGGQPTPNSMRITRPTTWSMPICSSRRTRPRVRPCRSRSAAQAVDHFARPTPMPRCRRGWRSRPATGRAQPASRWRPRPAPTRGASTRTPRPSTPSRAASAQPAAATARRRRRSTRGCWRCAT